LEASRVAEEAAQPGQASSDSEPMDLAKAARAVLLAWAIPGGGHFYLGKPRRALAFCAVVFAALAIGCSLDGNIHHIVADRPLSILATLGSMGMGLAYFVLRYLVGYAGDIVASGFEYGNAFILTAGLMNLLLTLDVWDIAAGRKE